MKLLLPFNHHTDFATGTKKCIKVLIKQMLKLALKLQNEAGSHSQSMFTYNIIFTSIQSKSSRN